MGLAVQAAVDVPKHCIKRVLGREQPNGTKRPTYGRQSLFSFSPEVGDMGHWHGFSGVTRDKWDTCIIAL